MAKFFCVASLLVPIYGVLGLGVETAVRTLWQALRRKRSLLRICQNFVTLLEDCGVTSEGGLQGHCGYEI